MINMSKNGIELQKPFKFNGEWHATGFSTTYNDDKFQMSLRERLNEEHKEISWVTIIPISTTMRNHLLLSHLSSCRPNLPPQPTNFTYTAEIRDILLKHWLHLSATENGGRGWSPRVMARQLKSWGILVDSGSKVTLNRPAYTNSEQVEEVVSRLIQGVTVLAYRDARSFSIKSTS